jgi:hypothetical protein
VQVVREVVPKVVQDELDTLLSCMVFGSSFHSKEQDLHLCLFFLSPSNKNHGKTFAVFLKKNIHNHP